MRSVHSISVLHAFLICTLLCASAAASPGFIENNGQTDAAVHYYIPGNRISVYVTDSGIVFDLHAPATPVSGLQQPVPGYMTTGAHGTSLGCAVHMRLTEPNPRLNIEARGLQETQCNYFLGNNPANWRIDVPVYSEVVFQNIYTGVDLVLTAYDWGLHYVLTESDPPVSVFTLFEFIGAERVSRPDESKQLIETSAGTIEIEISTHDTRSGRILYQPPNGLATPDTTPREDSSTLLWSSYLGGGNDESCLDLDTDSLGNPIMCGRTHSYNFPTSPGAYDVSYADVYDAYITKFSANGNNLLWSTFIGGDDWDFGCSAALDQSDGIYITGLTNSTDFPLVGAYDNTINGENDVFVCHLSADGSLLSWSTYVGGTGMDMGLGIALDADNNPIVAGPTNSTDFPVTLGAADIGHNGGYDMFMFKLSAGGASLLWGTYLGGDGEEWHTDQGFLGLDVDSSFNPVLSGSTHSDDFPVTPFAFNTSPNGSEDIFVTKLSGDGSQILWSTYFGGVSDDRTFDMVLDESDNVVFCGSTASVDLPTSIGALDPFYNGDRDGFVAALSPSGEELLLGTFLGGGQIDQCIGVSAHPSGICVTGMTESPDFPITTDAYDESHNGGRDVFITDLNPSVTGLNWSSYMGGSGSDQGWNISAAPDGHMYVAGEAGSAGFPTTPGAFDQTYDPGGQYGVDCFIARFDLPSIITEAYLHADGSGDFATIQDAVQGMPAASTIFLHDGAYIGDGNRDIEFYGKGMSIYSVSGDPESCVVDAGGAPADRHRGFYVVNTLLPTTIAGITIRHGNMADGVLGGGAIEVNSSVVTVSNCIIEYNAASYGGGLRVVGSGILTIEDCLLSGNSAISDGGAINVGVGSTADILNCDIVANTAFLGGGVYFHETAGDISGTTFRENYASDNGGGVYYRGSPVVAHIENCVFASNSSDDGGAVAAYSSTGVTIYGTTMYDNRALTTKSIGDKGSSIFSYGTPVQISNSVMSHSPHGEATYESVPASIQITCCDVYGNADGPGAVGNQLGANGNISEDPLYCDPLSGVLTLSAGSPCSSDISPCGQIGALAVGCQGLVIEVVDVPDDQGGWVIVSWDAFPQDVPGTQTPIETYDVLRLEDALWQSVGQVTASALPSYSITVETDDIFTIGESAPSSRYKVEGLTSDPLITYESLSITGFSIDNIPPVMPELVFWEVLGYRVLTWSNPEVDDFRDMCVYRSSEQGFIPVTPLTCTSHEFFNEDDLTYYCYRIAAFDIHGNMSEPSDEACSSYPTGVDEVPAALDLGQNTPNPFNPRTSISFDLPGNTAVRLKIYDVSGRLVRVLLDGQFLKSGRHEAHWDGLTDSGQEAAAGVYLYRLSAGDCKHVKRMTLVK